MPGGVFSACLATSRVIGVADFCEGGSTSYFAWWEMFPNGINLAFTVSPGDAITSGVTYKGGGNYTLFLNDHTSGHDGWMSASR